MRIGNALAGSLFLLCLQGGQAGAYVVNGVDILSSIYSLNAPWNYTWYQDDPDLGGIRVYSTGGGNYGATSLDGSPLARELASTGPFPPGLAFPGATGSTSMDAFRFVNNSQTWPGSQAFWGSDDRRYYVSGRVRPTASAAWTFRPTGDSMTFALHLVNDAMYAGFSGLSLSLSNLTQNTSLLVLGESDTWHRDGFHRPFLDLSQTFNVDPTDVFQFTINGWANSYDADHAFQSVQASILVVPEPGSLQLLLLGAFSAALVRRKHA